MRRRGVTEASRRGLRDHMDMPAYRVRAEFRRRTRESPWVLAGVRVRDEFWPAGPGIEPIRGRLPEPGLLGWAVLDKPILAPDLQVAAVTALELARNAWPERNRQPIPFPTGLAGDRPDRTSIT